MTGFKLCLTTINDEKKAKEIAKQLLQEKLVACVNISSSILSMYHWNDELVEEKEYLMMMKTLSDKTNQLQQFLLTIHPYDVPEFICLAVNDGNEHYLNWIKTSLQST